jgi:hypothetical protein
MRDRGMFWCSYEHCSRQYVLMFLRTLPYTARSSHAPRQIDCVGLLGRGGSRIALRSE